MNLDKRDAEYLLNRPEFLRFMYAAIQSGGIFANTPPANGQSGRDHELGRRSLGLDMIAALDVGQPDALRSPEALATIQQIIRSAMTTAPAKETTRGRRNDTTRYDDIIDRDDAE